MNTSQPGFIRGVVEGFYGRPWNPRQRHELFVWSQRWALNSYLYAPKDDLKHRSRWRESYSPTEASELSALIHDAVRHGLDFWYGIAPGLDIVYFSENDRAALRTKLIEVHELGCKNFGLLLDDIPDQLSSADAASYHGSLAAAQADLANDLWKFLNERIQGISFCFCPTAYCDRMADRYPGYLEELGEQLGASIQVLWTGPEIVSTEISAVSSSRLSNKLRRKPLIWDNLHANDYDPRRVYLGPYSGRPPELLNAVSGILVNPNCQFEANFVPIFTFSDYLKGDDAWRPRESYLAGIRQWWAAFQSADGPVISLDDLELLGDLFYLPHLFGDRALQSLAAVRATLGQDPAQPHPPELRGFVEAIERLFHRLPNLANRDLLHMIYPFVWELKEELHLLHEFLTWRRGGRTSDSSFRSPTHRPPIFRGGFAAEMQHLLPMDRTGTVQ